MKKDTVEDFIKNAKIGYLSKDEYRDFQKKLKSDKRLAETMNGIMSQEDFNVFYRGIMEDPSECGKSPD